ncbi:unnamed protein product [Vitrella brassicaformis CCMP3155]|uniref:Fe2OG dioxygenase domain-containing protein n=1 Tax=Vitrella brassicaformis (strain CCMP3155) TaxID=1169540 RepID=A0A0G4EXM4_VITBC|nr:unnamed protein product [Vitrella brassicaformis CCMP3155]|mmetsp:Transcript_30543/g.75827  ORF Transcript_30543/g.75827 Transcript_30543/m.75827 type:complete len:379 (-) Transcript_30543:339-1475(-)|eukprot:CEM04059.1 unnamed protein product [Vitrella brassicaformis CCMP3155]
MIAVSALLKIRQIQRDSQAQRQRSHLQQMEGRVVMTTPVTNTIGLRNKEESGAYGVPVVDLRQQKEAIVAEIRHACQVWGFFTVTGHGIDKDTFAKVLEAADGVLSLPLQDKMKLKAKEKGVVRGYMVYHGQLLDETTQTEPDRKEGFDFGEQFPADGSLGAADLPDKYELFYADNIWPDENQLPGFKQAVLTYQQQVRALGKRLTGYVSLAMGLPESFMADHAKHSPSLLRLLKYAAIKSLPEEGRVGCGAHTDWGLLTLLKTDGSGGLEIKPRWSDSWVEVAEPTDDCIIVNLGDMLQRWSNDVFVSTPHRVIIKQDRVRYSIPFFINADPMATVECVPTFHSAERPPRYPPVHVGEYLINKTLTHARNGAHEGDD